MTNSCFVVMVCGQQRPVLLGPMSPEVRTQHMRELRERYGTSCGLHELDLTADGPERVSVTVKTNKQEEIER